MLFLSQVFSYGFGTGMRIQLADLPNKDASIGPSTGSEMRATESQYLLKIEHTICQYIYKYLQVKAVYEKVLSASLFNSTQNSFAITPPRQLSGRVLASSAGGLGFNPQSRTASSIAQWQSAGFECRRSRVQSPVKDRVISKEL